jgi:hypothetical protein
MDKNYAVNAMRDALLERERIIEKLIEDIVRLTEELKKEREGEK